MPAKVTERKASTDNREARLPGGSGLQHGSPLGTHAEQGWAPASSFLLDGRHCRMSLFDPSSRHGAGGVGPASRPWAGTRG